MADAFEPARKGDVGTQVWGMPAQAAITSHSLDNSPKLMAHHRTTLPSWFKVSPWLALHGTMRAFKEA